MRKRLLSMLAILIICPIIASSVSASSSDEILQPQDIQNRHQLSNYIESVENINRNVFAVAETTSETVVPATITFSRYLTFDDLKEYIDLYDIELQQVQLRGLTKDGTRVTCATLVYNGMDYTEKLMYKQAAEQEFELVGITDVYAYILPSKIEAISQSEFTYLVDTSAVAARQNTGVENESLASEESVFPKSLTWELEDLNIL